MKMKMKIVLVFFITMLIVTLNACMFNNTKNSDEGNDTLSFSKLKKMDEITVVGNTVTVVLLQDIPLPYRWALTEQSENSSLIKEYEVEDPYNDSLFSSGSALEYHVFVLELKETDWVELEFYNKWVVEPENLSEANGSRRFVLECVNGQWNIVAN